MDAIVQFIEMILSPFLPEDVYLRLEFLYDAALIAMAVGITLLVLSAALMIATLMRQKKKAARG